VRMSYWSSGITRGTLSGCGSSGLYCRASGDADWIGTLAPPSLVPLSGLNSDMV
jgi:hypothetical protein